MTAKNYLLGVVVVIGAMCVPLASHAATLAPTFDAWIRDEGTSGPSGDFVREGDYLGVFSDAAGPPRRYGLLQFDVSSFAGKELVSASLNLFGSGTSSSGFPVRQQAFFVSTAGGTPLGNSLNYGQYVSEYEGQPTEQAFSTLGRYTLPSTAANRAEPSFANLADLALIQQAAKSPSGRLNIAFKMLEDGGAYRVDWGDSAGNGTEPSLHIETTDATPFKPYGETLEWRNNTGTSGWEIFTQTEGMPGQITTRVATRENQDVLILAREDGVAAYARASGGATSPDYGPTGIHLNLAGVTDVSSDDVHSSPTGIRVQVTAGGNTVEYVDGVPGTMVASGGGHTRGEIAFQQDRYWSVQNGDLTAYARSGDPWTQILAPVSSMAEQNGLPYIDVTMRSQAEDYRVLALTATGIDEYAWDDSATTLFSVASYPDLFADATGISIDGDQDVVYVSTLHGLLQLDRTDGGFFPSGISVIDATRSYLDVDVPRGDARAPGDSAIVWAVVAPTAVPEPSTWMLLLGSLALVGGQRRMARRVNQGSPSRTSI